MGQPRLESPDDECCEDDPADPTPQWPVPVTDNRWPALACSLSSWHRTQDITHVLWGCGEIQSKIGPECSIAAELQILNCRRSFRRNFIVYHILISSKSRNLIFQTSWIIPHPLWNVKVKTSLCDHCFSSSAAWPDPGLASGWPDSQHWTLAGLFSSGSKLSVSILNI